MKSRIVPTLIVLAALGLTGWFIAGAFRHATGDHPSAAEESAVEASGQIVTLSPGKLAAAGIELGRAEPQLMQPLVTVPGRVQYDDTRHIEVKAPTAGILTDVRVKPGVEVQEGDVLALLSSPEVGAARADVLKRQVEYELAQQRQTWKKGASEGLQRLVEAVRQGQDPQTIVDVLEKLTLGKYREQVVSVYSRYRLAQSLAAAAQPALDSGALSGRMIQERLSERDAAQAALKAVTEQSLFEARQEDAAAHLEASDAQRRLKISQHQLHTLLGYEEQVNPDADEESLSLVGIRAPIAGTIESKRFSKAERVVLGDSLFVLANTTRLWVAADIREREWLALSLKNGQSLIVDSPALPDRRLQAQVEYIGREVDPRSNAVPLVALIQNEDGLLRPGQFVWVQLPLGSPHSGLAVPAEAVVEHEGRKFVFAPAGEGSFRRRDVAVGLQQGPWAEIVSGLSDREEIVVKGAFLLKSELLLEREE